MSFRWLAYHASWNAGRYFRGSAGLLNLASKRLICTSVVVLNLPPKAAHPTLGSGDLCFITKEPLEEVICHLANLQAQENYSSSIAPIRITI